MRRLRAVLIVCVGTLMFLWAAQNLRALPAAAGIPAFGSASKPNEPAAGMFLVAQRDLRDPYFGQTVILLLQHDANGSLGLIVNRKVNLQLSDAVADIDQEEASKHSLFFGGPLGTHRIFMLLREDDATGQAHQITPDIYFSAQRDVLEHVLDRKTPDSELRIFLGYSSWSAGQLDGELKRDSWHLAESDSEAIFAAGSNGLWERLIETLEPPGIEVKRGPAEGSRHTQAGLQTVQLRNSSTIR